mgnify:CR=1 FL=1|tara:strand:- start:1654 stop:2511 length:858 start_codon:yes stop_codon:yes gene_type:complete
MKKKKPIIALTGPSGAGKTNIKSIFEAIFKENQIKAVYIQGDSFHKYTRTEMEALDKKMSPLTHFSPESNHLDLLADLFKNFSISGNGIARQYAHSEKDANKLGINVGCFSEWKEIEQTYDILLYEGLHGGYKDDQIDITRYVDLLIGITPSINLEWVQKSHRDLLVRGYSKHQVKKLIIKRLPDYLDYICPQFSRTDANLERIPLVDLSDPFRVESIPPDKNSIYMLSIRNESILKNLDDIQQKKWNIFNGEFGSTTQTIRAKDLKTCLKNIFLPTILSIINQE